MSIPIDPASCRTELCLAIDGRWFLMRDGGVIAVLPAAPEDQPVTDVIKAREAPARRRKAVMLAREHGWSKYRIAATLGVKGPTVDSIIASAEREQGER